MQNTRRQVLRNFGLLSAAASAGVAGTVAFRHLEGNDDHTPSSIATAAPGATRNPMMGFGKPRGEATVTWAVETRRKVVALTFDDGPVPNYTPMVLDALDAAGVPATFFLVGARLKQNAAIVKGRMDHHEVGNHTYSHRDLSPMDFEAAHDEIKKAHDIITKVTGREPRLLRPPFGHISTLAFRAADRFGYNVVLWSHDVTEKSFQAKPEAVIPYVTENLRPGSILLAHDAGAQGVEPVVLRRIGTVVAAMREKGYRFVTVSELLTMREPGLGLAA